MKRLRNIVLLFAALAFSAEYSDGQVPGQGIPGERCKTMISEAERLYNDGLYDQSIAILGSVLHDCDLTRKDKEHAMEILSKSYVEAGDIGKADSMAFVMLNKYPHYELDENENYESYNRIVKRYNIHPSITIGIRNTAMWSKFVNTRIFSLPEGPANKEPLIHEDYSFMYYGWGEIEFNRGISLNGDIMWWTNGYNRRLTKEPDLEIAFSENMEFVEIPLYVKKYFYPFKNLLPYVTGGLGWLYLTKSNGYVSKREQDALYFDDNINLVPIRTRNNFEWLAGVGIGYKIKNIRMFGDIRYYGGLTSLASKSHRFDNSLLQEQYLYIDNDYKMNKFEIGASISYTLRNSVKRRK